MGEILIMIGMKEIKVGDYVRTRRGEIDKFKEYGSEKLLVRCENKKYWLSDITKHSPNIIDLIEVGDYVNGEEVTSIYDENKEDEIIQLEFNNCGNYIYFTNNDVKNIVTHEQFNSIKYEVI